VSMLYPPSSPRFWIVLAVDTVIFPVTATIKLARLIRRAWAGRGRTSGQRARDSRAMKHTIGCIALLAVVSGLHLSGEQATPDDKRPTFAVASVKPNRSGEEALNNRFTQTQAAYINYPVRVLIYDAYRVNPDRLVGGPEWIRSDRFDVLGSIPPGSRPGDRQLMLQRVLEERFGLKHHREVREVPIYLLVRARADGRLGPGLRPSTFDCSGPPRTSKCGTMIGFNAISGRGTDWGFLSLPLQLGLDRPAVDKTGLSGNFDIEFKWSRDVSPTGDQPFVFTAIEEQLGLKLQPGRAPLDVMVIDAVSRPTPD
jgi:uncharacterized protein (TIGR03435 family)